MGKVRYRFITPDERQQILTLARSGMTYHRIAAAVGRSKGTIATVTHQAILAGDLEPRRTLTPRYGADP